MKKILFVMNTMGRAGAEMALLELLRRLVEAKMDVSLFVLTGQGEIIDKVPDGVHLLNKSYKEISVHTPEGKRHLFLTSCKALFTRGNIIRLFPYILKNAWSMLKKKTIMPDKLLWRALSDGAIRFEDEYDIAVAYIEGGSTYYVSDHVNAKKKVAFFHVDYSMAGYSRMLDKNCYENFHKIFPISGEVAAAFLEVYPEHKDKVEVFENLINKDRILKMSKLEGGFTDKYEGIRILTVGRLVPQKDFAQSIEAMKLLKDYGTNAKWYILGEGEQREELEKLIHKLDLENDFFLLGVTDNPYAYMAQADIYVHASRFEGKSIAIQEAQVLEKPIIVSDCSGNREQVNHGTDGLICDFTPEAISSAVMTLLANPNDAKAYGKAAGLRHKDNDTEISKLLSLL